MLDGANVELRQEVVAVYVDGVENMIQRLDRNKDGSIQRLEYNAMSIAGFSLSTSIRVCVWPHADICPTSNQPFVCVASHTLTKT